MVFAFAALIVKEFCHSKTCPAEVRKCTYRLFSVLVHRGKFSTGHYYAYVRKDDRWWRCDDSKVDEVKQDEVMRSQAYMLFYARQY
jgi:ubiquitin carboxyl-terminal hydrolase 22/27/51